MPEVAEIKIIDEQVWIRVDLKRNSEVNMISLWTPTELADHEQKLLKSFWTKLVEDFLEQR